MRKQYEYYRDELLMQDSKATVNRLADVCELIADGDHMPPKSDSGVPFVTISNISEYNQIDFSDTMFVPQSYYDTLAEKRRPKTEDILYTVVGS